MEENLKRYLDKWEETATFAFEYFTKQSESYAAQHINKTVFYSPICQRLKEMLDDMKIVRETN